MGPAPRDFHSREHVRIVGGHAASAYRHVVNVVRIDQVAMPGGANAGTRNDSSDVNILF
jgi:hypothetical protein